MALKTHTILCKLVHLSISHSIAPAAHCGDCEKDSSPWGDLQQGVCEISFFTGCLKGISMFFLNGFL